MEVGAGLGLRAWDGDAGRRRTGTGRRHTEARAWTRMGSSSVSGVPGSPEAQAAVGFPPSGSRGRAAPFRAAGESCVLAASVHGRRQVRETPGH